MASNWVRGKADRPEKRRIVLIYETDESKNAHLEQLLERIPYGHGNKTLLECLRIGAKAMLSQLTGQAADSPAAKPAQTTAAASSQENGPSFSRSAKRMFEQTEKNL